MTLVQQNKMSMFRRGGQQSRIDLVFATEKVVTNAHYGSLPCRGVGACL